MDFAAILEYVGALLADIDYELIINTLVTYIGDLISSLM